MNSSVTFFIFLMTLHLSTIRGQVNIENAFPNLSFTQPVDLTYAPDGTNRLFILEQEGLIYVFGNVPGVTEKTLFLDISERVSFGGERGLLGLAFHPDYMNNGYFYVNYTAPTPLRTVISRFEVMPDNPNDADELSEFIILEIDQPFANHNGGQIVFDSDGYLHIGMGDGGAGGDPFGNGQDLETLLGSLLRIDVNSSIGDLNYGIPTNNPFYGNTDGFREEIYAYGLRNPWRFSFDPVTGWLWLADVGQNVYEEIDLIIAGGNYGWNIMEGLHCFSPPTNCDTAGLIMPIFEYDHTVGESITGGYVYRGNSVPDLYGKYIFADFEVGTVWSLEYDNDLLEVEELGTLGLYSVTSFGVDQYGELYICSFDGNIYKFIQEFEYNEGDLQVLGEVISVNGLSMIPLDFGNQEWDMGRLIDLQYFNEDAPLQALPFSFGNLDALQSLDFSENNLTILPVTFGNLVSLVYLDIESNLLESLPESMGDLSNLEEIRLSGNRLYCVNGEQDTTLIPDFLTDGSILYVYGLYNQECEEIPGGEFLEITFTSIIDSDTVSSRAELYIQFSELIDLNSMDADSVVYYVFSQDDTVIIDSTRFFLENVQNVTLNEQPQSFWYDSNTATCVFIKETTILNPEGTGVGFYPSTTNLLRIKDIRSISGDTLEGDFELFFFGNELTDIDYVTLIPNPYIQSPSWVPGPREYRVYFIHLPAICTISVYDLDGNLIQLISHNDINDGTEQWNLIDLNGDTLSAGVYYWEVESPDLGEYRNGVMFIVLMNYSLSIKNDIFIPSQFVLYQNYPNPFNPETTIRFDLPVTANVSIVIYDILGREVAKLVDGFYPAHAGFHKVQWNASHVASGIYIYQLTADEIRITKQMLLIK